MSNPTCTQCKKGVAKLPISDPRFCSSSCVVEFAYVVMEHPDIREDWCKMCHEWHLRLEGCSNCLSLQVTSEISPQLIDSLPIHDLHSTIFLSRRSKDRLRGSLLIGNGRKGAFWRL